MKSIPPLNAVTDFTAAATNSYCKSKHFCFGNACVGFPTEGFMVLLTDEHDYFYVFFSPSVS